VDKSPSSPARSNVKLGREAYRGRHEHADRLTDRQSNSVDGVVQQTHVTVDDFALVATRRRRTRRCTHLDDSVIQLATVPAQRARASSASPACHLHYKSPSTALIYSTRAQTVHAGRHISATTNDKRHGHGSTVGDLGR